MKIERTCRCIKCKNELFKGYREKIGRKWNIQEYKNNAIYLPNVGWLCLDHFSKEGLIHERDVKYYSLRIYLLNKRVYVEEKLTFRDDKNLSVYELKPSKPINHFWGSYEETEGEGILDKSEDKILEKNRVWIL